MAKWVIQTEFAGTEAALTMGDLPSPLLSIIEKGATRPGAHLNHG